MRLRRNRADYTNQDDPNDPEYSAGENIDEARKTISNLKELR
jgi:hypothetical protein